MAVLLLLHVPPAGELVSIAELPLHTAPAPEILPGLGLTVNKAVVKQPVGKV
jgi:hypothetical protein